MSRSVVSPVPSAIESSCGKWATTPNRSAVWATAAIPTFCASRTVMRLRDCSRPTRSGFGPRKILLVVGRLPGRQPGSLLELDRGVDHDRGRREAVAQGGQVDEGLEGGTRLPPGLDRAIELIAPVLELIAAAHREHAAGMGIEGDDGATDLGNLAQRIAGRGIGLAVRPLADQLDQDDVAPLEHVG